MSIKILSDKINLNQFDYNLPDDLIAHRPSKNREKSKIMVVKEDDQKAEIYDFEVFSNYLLKGDCLVINDTKVIPARLFGNKETGGKIEALLMHSLENGHWQIMARPTKRLKIGSKIFIDKDSFYTITAKNKDGTCHVNFGSTDVLHLLDNFGEIPLPPYINRSCDEEDKLRYQTVFADKQGAVAAPTAGLHFTNKILKNLENKGVNIVRLTLHIGPGTFLPINNNDITKHKMHSEAYELSESSVKIIRLCKKRGNKIFAIGTTTVRVLETCVQKNGILTAGSGWTDIFLYPPYKMQIVDGLLTNFHFPKSTLLMLVSCLVGRKKILKLYKQAIEEKMRFFSYGDCMLILPKN